MLAARQGPASLRAPPTPYRAEGPGSKVKGLGLAPELVRQRLDVAIEGCNLELPSGLL